MDHLCRFENYADDARLVFDALNFPRITIPHINSSKRSEDYRTVYNDAAIDVVSELYSEDIENFNYSF